LTHVPKAAALSPGEITRRSKSSFLLSFAFLSRPRRRALCAIYAFCRAVDDAADDAHSRVEGEEQLRFWSRELDAVAAGTPVTQTGLALQDAVRRFGVPVNALREIVRGCEHDLAGAEFATFAELELYCHRVASCVGLACLPVFGAAGAAAERYARSLGLALQLTNILRDLRDDARNGRCYVPREVFERHGVAGEWLLGDGPPAVYAGNGPAARLVAELASVAHGHFTAAAAGLPVEDRRRLLPAEIMGAVYFDLLRRVEARGGRLDLAERPRVPRRRRLALALRTWWRGRR